MSDDLGFILELAFVAFLVLAIAVGIAEEHGKRFLIKFTAIIIGALLTCVCLGMAGVGDLSPGWLALAAVIGFITVVIYRASNKPY